MGTRVGVEGRGRYRSPDTHYSFPNQGENDRLLTSPGDIVGGDGIVGYRSQTNHSSYQIEDSRGVGERISSRFEEINHSSLLYVV